MNKGDAGLSTHMKYILEDSREFGRLEAQSAVAAYDHRKELADFKCTEGVILDAGSGSGVVSRWLAGRFPGAKVIGCDQSAERVRLARVLAAELQNLDFQIENLTQLSLATGSVDAIACRYVLEHMKPPALKESLHELNRCLKPGGHLWVVDVDGFLGNLFPQSDAIREGLDRISRSGAVDLDIGRKLPSLLVETGFENISWKIETLDFHGDALELEAAMLAERFENARPVLVEILGSTGSFEKFTAAIQDTLRSPGVVLFYNKFIVCGRKPPESRLQRIK